MTTPRLRANDPQEAIVDPELGIVDPHHHLWDFPGRRYLFEDWHADFECGHDIRSTVFVQCHAMYRADGPEHLRPLGETEFATGIAAMYASGRYGPARACAGLVAKIDLTLGEGVSDLVAAHRAVAGERLKGVRHITAWNADASLLNPVNKVWPGMLAEPSFRAGVVALARAGLLFEAWLLHPQLGELAALADALPEATIVLDHLGGPIGVGPYAGRRHEAFSEWRSALAELGRRPNVVLKIGGLGMPMFGFGFEARETPAPAAELAAAWRPYIEAGIEAFGVGRCMLESNFPVDKVTCSYRTLWNAYKLATAGLTREERNALFHGTARQVYTLPETP